MLPPEALTARAAADARGRRSRSPCWSLGSLTVGRRRRCCGAASEARQQRQAFQLDRLERDRDARDVASADADFVSTIRSLLTMQPALTPIAVQHVVRDAPGTQAPGRRPRHRRRRAESRPRSCDGFLARRNADPAFRSLVGAADPSPAPRRRAYCLLAAGAAIVTLDRVDLARSSSRTGARRVGR